MMTESVSSDLSKAVNTLSIYVEKGVLPRHAEEKQEPLFRSKSDASKLKSLKKLSYHDGKFVAVDCSTKTLRRANNWGIYFLRATYALVEGRTVDWGFNERIQTLLGPAYVRRNLLRNLRFEAESELALGQIRKLDSDDYVLLDGASYFGEKTGFHISLFEECKKKTLNLLTLSKQSPSLHDECGRDFQATIQTIAQQPIWLYHPVAKARPAEHLYGDISIIKLCSESSWAFRCDIMEYLTSHDIVDVISPLTALAEDPRCLGYPVPLWLAHDFSATSNAKLLHYYEQVEKLLKQSGLYDRLIKEELACSFADELHGIRYPFEREWIEYG